MKYSLWIHIDTHNHSSSSYKCDLFWNTNWVLSVCLGMCVCVCAEYECIRISNTIWYNFNEFSWKVKQNNMKWQSNNFSVVKLGKIYMNCVPPSSHLTSPPVTRLASQHFSLFVNGINEWMSDRADIRIALMYDDCVCVYLEENNHSKFVY